MNYELVIGLETHVELATKTKIFCGCPNKFGNEPNTNCCPICMGFPGTLPVINREAVNLAIKAGLALNCTINLVSRMDRKNYIYPDLPKAYQISQLFYPICTNGHVELSSGKKIRINRIHIEEDAGKLVHKHGDVFVDYNRGGVPLIEIVTEPDITSAEETREYVEKLQLILRYIGASDCKMQEGSMRCDVNISVRPVGQKEFGVRTEIKNMNSITFMTKAIEYEHKRHIDVIENGGKITQETLRYIETTNSTESMRDKEDAQDYRYFRDPDLVDIVLEKAQIENIKNSLPELPDSRMKKYTTELGISESDATLIIKYKNVADFFEKAIKNLKSPKTVANFITGQIFRNLEIEDEKEKFNIKLTPENLNELASLVENGKINMNIAKSTLPKMLEIGKSVSEFLSESDMQGITEEELKKLCQEAINKNANAVQDYLNGKEKAIKAILGFVMRLTKGKGDAQTIEKMLVELINSQK